MLAGGLLTFCDRSRRGTTVARPAEGGSWSGNHCERNVWLPRTASDGKNVAVAHAPLICLTGSTRAARHAPANITLAHPWRPEKAKRLSGRTFTDFDSRMKTKARANITRAHIWLPANAKMVL